jgi:ketosteroid isomerase-like protein
MSEESVDVIRQVVEAFNRGGVEAALRYFDPEINWVGPPEWLEDHLYEGHEGLRRLASQWTENFDEYHLDPERFMDTGDEVVVLLFARGRIKGSAIPVDQAVTWVCQVRNGKAAHVQVYFSWEEGLEAAGLSEWVRSMNGRSTGDWSKSGGFQKWCRAVGRVERTGKFRRGPDTEI